MPQKISIHWFRRDLRLQDNSALYHALNSGLLIMPIFIYDTDILSLLSHKNDLRVTFIHREVEKLNISLKALDHRCANIQADPKKFSSHWLHILKLIRYTLIQITNHMVLTGMLEFQNYLHRQELSSGHLKTISFSKNMKS